MPSTRCGRRRPRSAKARNRGKGYVGVSRIEGEARSSLSASNTCTTLALWHDVRFRHGHRWRRRCGAWIPSAGSAAHLIVLNHALAPPDSLPSCDASVLISSVMLIETSSHSKLSVTFKMSSCWAQGRQPHRMKSAAPHSLIASRPVRRPCPGNSIRRRCQYGCPCDRCRPCREVPGLPA
jgi:hypothetical protein